MLVAILFSIAFIPMIAEAARSVRNERELRAAGATEPEGDVYRAMQLVYPACFIAILGEAWLRGRTVTGVSIAGAAVFVTAKALKYWAISTLGVRWSFRVLVPPGSQLARSGPYRYIRHPNYVAVVGEIAGMALMAQAPIAGSISLVVFTVLILIRIRVEERALGVRS
jgi:methyltransferase